MTADDSIEEIREQRADEPVAVRGAPELRETVDAHDVVLVEFYADWCGPCQQLEPVVERIAADGEPAERLVGVRGESRLRSVVESYT